MANFERVVIGIERRNILDMIDNLRKSVETAEAIPVCTIESYSDLNYPNQNNITIKIGIVPGRERTNG